MERDSKSLFQKVPNQNGGNRTTGRRKFSGNKCIKVFCVRHSYLLQVLVWVGVFYVAKLALSALLDLRDGVNGFILPKIWRRDLSRYNPPKENF